MHPESWVASVRTVAEGRGEVAERQSAAIVSLFVIEGYRAIGL